MKTQIILLVCTLASIAALGCSSKIDDSSDMWQINEESATSPGVQVLYIQARGKMHASSEVIVKAPDGTMWQIGIDDINPRKWMVVRYDKNGNETIIPMDTSVSTDASRPSSETLASQEACGK